MFTKSIIKSNEDIISVRFNHFDNSSRIKFFYSFTNNFTIYLEFKSITDIDLYLDEDVDSHEDVKIFLDEIDNLKLSGKGLQNHVLLCKEEYFPKLIFGAIKLRYKLSFKGIEGSALVNLGFPDYVKSKDENTDFQISIELILSREDKNQTTENNIRKVLLEFFEKKKIESYNKFKTL
ncbi:hypothetical protein [uncultured Chryseobacterium sp.]|jgi:hypothetical protein|uniref:hypothetical protein n=1 Tax=uncultured Chryseobacterium sp. TaxID=259322 RepID=UPI002614A13C|nr:hypothetical protein [uncultured Chryseobacterium sp.]